MDWLRIIGDRLPAIGIPGGLAAGGFTAVAGFLARNGGGALLDIILSL